MKIYSKFKELFHHFYLAIEWRVIASFITFIAAYSISGDITISIGITSVEAIAKVLAQTLWLRYRVKIHHHKLITLENEKELKERKKESQ